MKRWLVTGGAGFIGSHLVDTLIGAGDKVCVIDDFSSGRPENLEVVERSPRLSVTKGDAGDTGLLRQALAGRPDGIFHLAATVQVQDCIREWLGSHRTNATATLALMEQASRLGAVPVVYTSSAAVYGDRAGEVCHEGMAERPLSPYGADKLACEHHARAFASIHRLPTAGLRLFNVYGPRQRAASSHSGVLARFIRNVAEAKPHTIFGDGGQSRDFVHVSDVVHSLCAAMHHITRAPGAEVVNVCTGQPTSVREAAALIDMLAGRNLPFEYAPPRSGEIAHSHGSTARLRNIIGAHPFLALEEGIAPMIEAVMKRRVAG